MDKYLPVPVVLYDGKETAPILLDEGYFGNPYSSRSYRQIVRAVGDLRQDIAIVTGAIKAGTVQQQMVDDPHSQAVRLATADQSKVPTLIHTVEGGKRIETAVIIGSISDSPIIRQLMADGKLEEARQIEGKWEAYLIAAVDHPFEGIERALVIAGSDARGTIFGIYTLSEWLGVSPWYWYSDVPVLVQEHIVLNVLVGEPIVEEGPDVKYRGIFINDEERTIDWAKEKFVTENGTPNVNFYRHVFELLLRLKCNVLWPAMHEGTTAFNKVTDENGFPVNAKEAAEYGVIMSASHCEMLLRNNVDEWEPWYEAHRNDYDWSGDNYKEAFDYTLNKEAILAYWKERLSANREFESILALGIRGVHDGKYAYKNLSETFGTEIAIMADVIQEQRKLIEEVYGRADAAPQVFIPYKEMGNLYNEGLKAFLPDDIMLMWAEDNYGYLRQVPNSEERSRFAGSGIYYHSSYWGSPKSYLWLNSIQLSLMVEQFRRAYDTGAGTYWILNVGDIKPGEIVLECFTKLSWDVTGQDDKKLESEFLKSYAMRNYHLSEADATTVAKVMDQYFRLCGTKRPEFFGTENPSSVHTTGFREELAFPFSVTGDGDEGQLLVEQCNWMLETLTTIYDKLDEQHQAALYQQLLHHVTSYLGVAEEYVYYWKNRLAAAQGRYTSAKIYAELSRKGRTRIQAAQDKFWELSDGKWRKAIGYSHPITYYGGVNEGIVLLGDDRYSNVSSPAWGAGAAAEGQKTAGVGTLRFHSRLKDVHYFDVFSRGKDKAEWVAEAERWIVLSASAGSTTAEERVKVTIDWSNLSISASGLIQVFNANNGKKAGEPIATFVVTATVSEVTFDGPSFIEANGYIALEAEHYSENRKGKDGSEWRPIKSNGSRGDTMKAFPDTAERVDNEFAKTAQLRYRIYFSSTGMFKGTFYRIPTLNEGFDDYGIPRSCRTAIGLDEVLPSRAQLDGQSSWGGRRWEENIMRMVESLEFSLTVQTPGWHDLVIYRSDASIVFSRIVIETEQGAVGDSLLGPIESPNNIAGDDEPRNRVAGLTRAICE
ncbi:glycosyl hydrolase 115 family protein [Paenibacillus lupini]